MSQIKKNTKQIAGVTVLAFNPNTIESDLDTIRSDSIRNKINEIRKSSNISKMGKLCINVIKSLIPPSILLTREGPNSSHYPCHAVFVYKNLSLQIQCLYLQINRIIAGRAKLADTPLSIFQICF